jgi:hypothetical protein
MLAREARYGDAEFRAFLRRYQRRCLLMGKARATAALDARQASRWNPAATAVLADRGEATAARARLA